MLNSYSDLSIFAPTPSNITLHAPASTANPTALLADMTSGLIVQPGYPEHIRELDDVFVVPGVSTACLYDSDGLRIDESCVRRGEHLDDYVGSTEVRVRPPTEFTTISTPVLYLSMFFQHWGHFVTESTSRLWARSANPELRDLAVGFAGFTQGFKRAASAGQFLAGLASPPRMLPARGVVRLSKCFLPAPSFVNRAAAHVGHLDAAREVAVTLLPRERPRRSGRPVYLSRSRLATGGRVIVNEREFEAILAGAGVLIAHPQEMSLREQILLFNTHAAVIGCAGSALHNLLFALDGREVTTYVLSEMTLNRNCLLIDAIVGNASHYLCVLRAAATPGAIKALSIDIPAAVECLRAEGILPLGAGAN